MALLRESKINGTCFVPVKSKDSHDFHRYTMALIKFKVQSESRKKQQGSASIKTDIALNMLVKIHMLSLNPRTII